MKVLLSVIILFTFYSCTKKKQGTDKQNNSNNLRLEISSALSTLDPAVCYDTICNKVLNQMLEPLFEYHYLKRPYELKPLLAEDLPLISKDGLTYTIKIKKNIFYHSSNILGDKRTVTAQDFINQIKRIAFIPTKSRGWWLFENKVVGLDEYRKTVGSDYEKFLSTKISGLRATDDHTLIIKLKKPYPQLKFGLAMTFTAPMPLEAIKHHKNELNANVYATGPYRLTKWVRESKIELERNTKYRPVTYPKLGDRFSNKKNLLKDAGKTIPMIDKVTFLVMKEAQTAWLNFRRQKIDMIVVQKDNFTSVVTVNGKLTEEMAAEGIKLEMANSLIYWWMSFNMQHPILGKNKNLRMAVAHAINWENYIKIFTNNIGQRSNSIYPPGIPGYDPSASLPYKYDLKLAKDYLAKAGYKDGKNLPEFKFDVRSTSTLARQQAEFIQKELRKINMQIKVVTNTFPGFLKKAHEGKLNFWQDGWSLDYPDAENILGLLISQNHPPGSNTAYYSNKQVDALYEKLITLQDSEEKFKIMKEIEKIVLNDVPWIMQYYQRQYIVHHDYLFNYRHSDIVNNYVKYLRLKSH